MIWLPIGAQKILLYRGLRKNMSKPVAVLISDVHYSLQTLQLADVAMRMAIDKANSLRVPLIVAGDLHDTKANLRGECVNAMIETFKRCYSPPYILVGNHDRLNEKAPAHSLNFLANLTWHETNDPYGIDSSEMISNLNLVETPGFYNDLGSINGKSIHLIPYQHDSDELRAHLKTIDKGSCVIMHQGLTGTNSGHYIQDKSAITHEDVADFRVISGHYHTRQTIKTGRPQKGAVGLFDYIGNSYTLNFAEANDPPKGFQILMNDGALEFVPTNLRKHVVYDISINLFEITGTAPYAALEDLVWVKIKGTKEELSSSGRKQAERWINRQAPFRLDLIPTDTVSTKPTTKLVQGALLDSLIDSLTNTSDARKMSLKDRWKTLCE